MMALSTFKTESMMVCKGKAKFFMADVSQMNGKAWPDPVLSGTPEEATDSGTNC